MSFSFASELKARATDLVKAEASKITQKSGTTVRVNHYVVLAGAEKIKSLRSEKEQEIKANSERYSEKVAKEMNAPIINELNEGIKAIKDSVKKITDENIDARIMQANKARAIPIRNSRMQLIQTIRMLIEFGATISENDWKQWGEQFAGHYLEEKVFTSLAKTQGIDILPVSNPDRSIENLETFRQMKDNAIEYLDHPNDSLMAMAFFKPGEQFAKLMDDIDSDMASMIPAEKLSVLKRLKDAKQNAYNKDNVLLSVKIQSFIDRNLNELSTPEELKDALYEQAEEYIQKGMNAKKGDE